ncbi:unnamed protein product, partial [Amoebophrya sp. A25]
IAQRPHDQSQQSSPYSPRGSEPFRGQRKNGDTIVAPTATEHYAFRDLFVKTHYFER